MRLIAASQAPAVGDWLASTNHARVDGSFERAFNLVNMRGQFLSVVAPEIGDGPFAMVLADAPKSFQQIVAAGATASVLGKKLRVDALMVDFSKAALWQPRPAWERLVAGPKRIVAGLPSVRTLLRVEAPDGSMATLLKNPWQATFQTAVTAADAIMQFSGGLAEGNRRQVVAGARALAGLGGGLTPSGDDFLIGALHALWATNWPEKAAELSEMIAGVAAPRTTQLSAAWLWAAARGETGQRWHAFVDELFVGKVPAVVRAARRIMAIGHTSGADALAGFVTTMQPDHVYSVVAGVGQRRYFAVPQSLLAPT